MTREEHKIFGCESTQLIITVEALAPGLVGFGVCDSQLKCFSNTGEILAVLGKSLCRNLFIEMYQLYPD